MPFLIVGMSFLIYYLSSINKSGKTNIAIVDENDFVASSLFVDNEEVAFQEITALGLEEAKQRVAEDNFDALLYLPPTSSLEALKSELLMYCEEVPDNPILTK